MLECEHVWPGLIIYPPHLKSAREYELRLGGGVWCGFGLDFRVWTLGSPTPRPIINKIAFPMATNSGLSFGNLSRLNYPVWYIPKNSTIYAIFLFIRVECVCWELSPFHNLYLVSARAFQLVWKCGRGRLFSCRLMLLLLWMLLLLLLLLVLLLVLLLLILIVFIAFAWGR